MTKTMTNNKNIKYDITKEKVLKKYFGYSSFRPGQDKVIDSILNLNDTLAIMPTGAGKSICYEVPSMVMDGITLVISPLIALMKDQVDNLNNLGIKASYVNSSMTSKEIFYSLKNAREGKVKILYIAPERLDTPNFNDFINDPNSKINFIAVDEAHCVSAWGHDFRRSYLAIKTFRKKLEKIKGAKIPIAAFTATATLKVKKDIIKELKLNEPYVLTTTFDRPNIYFRTIKTNDKINFINEYVNKHQDESGIIYCLTRNDTTYVTKVLKEKGIDIEEYHAGLSKEKRIKVQEDFIYDKIKLIACTNAFGMGIDKPNVRYVIHYSMPKNLEGYYQEAGRAGRDGELSEAIMLYNDRDYKLNEFMIDKSTSLNSLDSDNNSDNKDSDNKNNTISDIDPKELSILKRRDTMNLKRIYNYANTKECLRKNMLNYFGETYELDNCNFCSNCTSNLKLTDITIEAMKILSCIKRLNEDETRDIIITTLRGVSEKDNKETCDIIFNNKYDLLSTYGILKINKKDLTYIFEFLHKNKYTIKVKTSDNRMIYKVSDKGKLVLAKKQKVYLMMDESYNLIKKAKNRNSANTSSSNKKYDEVLFKLLKLARRNISKKIRLPEFMIALDKVLKDMAIYKPRTISELMDIEGMGEYKAKKFGEVFIDVIKEYTSFKN